MKLIKYFNKELVGHEDNIRVEKDPVSGKEFKYTEKLPIFEVRPQRYECTDEEFEYWLDIITRTYGKYGEVTHEDIPEPPKEPTEAEKLFEAINALAKQMTLEKLDLIRMKSDIQGGGEEIVKIKLQDIEGSNV